MNRIRFNHIVRASEGEYHVTINAHLEPPDGCGFPGGWIVDSWHYERRWYGEDAEEAGGDRDLFRKLFGQEALDMAEQAACDNACGEMESARIEGSERA